MTRIGGSLLRAFYRLLLLAYPREFRRHSGEEATAVFLEACEESRRRGGRAALLRRLLISLVEAPRGGFEERIAGARAKAPRAGRGGRRIAPLRDLAADVRFAARSLRRRPGFALAVVTTLALGIGANTAIFSVIEATLLAPTSPWPDAERVVFVRGHAVDHGLTFGVTLEVLQRWQAAADVFDRLEASNPGVPVLTDADGARRVDREMVTSGYLDALGIDPVIGRLLAADDARPDAPPVVVIPEVAWRSFYDGDPGIIGRSFLLDGVSHTVVGVIPEVRGKRLTFYTPLALSGPPAHDFLLNAVAWLRPGVSLEEARDRLAAVAVGSDAELGDYYGEIVRPTNEFWERDEFRSALLALMAAVFLLLAVACVNVANLLLASVGARSGELAVRAALGANRSRLARFFLTESLLLAAIGGLLGVAVANAGITLMRWMSPGELLGEALEAARLDPTVLAYTSAVAAFCALAVGTLPALWRVGWQHGALQGAGPRAGGARPRLRGLLVAAETALSLVLLVAAGLTFRSFVGLRITDPGFDADRILSVGIPLPESRYPTAEARRAFFNRLVDSAESIAGVADVSLGYGGVPPSKLLMGGKLEIEGREAPADAEAWASWSVVEAGFLHFMGTPLVAGRDFEEADLRTADTADDRPTLINASMARRYWPDGDAVGARFRFNLAADKRWNRVVGVASDVTQQGFETPEETLHYYELLADRGARYCDLMIRVQPGAAPPIAEIRAMLRRLDPQIPTDQLDTAAAGLLGSIAGSRFRATLFGVFGVVAVALAAIGIFGVVAYTVTQRTREMGIRLALGAAPSDVRRLVLWQGSAPVLIGTLIGLVMAFGVTRLMADFLHGVTAADPLTFVVTGSALWGVGLLATWVPACRATATNPVLALRQQ